MLHQGTPSTPNQCPYCVLFEPDGFSQSPRCLTASASAFWPEVCFVGGVGGCGGAFLRSAARVAGPTTPSTASFCAFWKARTAAAVVGPYWPSWTPGLNPQAASCCWIFRTSGPAISGLATCRSAGISLSLSVV